MRRGSRAIIEVDGRQYEARYVGKGKYSRVYRVGDRVVYYTTGDCAKEVISMFQYDRMMHLPEIIRHDNLRTGKTLWYVFSSPYYRDVTKKDSSAYSLAKRMINFYVDVYGRSGLKGIYAMQAFVNDMEAARARQYRGYEKGFPKSVIRAMQELVDVSSNCGGQVGFDLHMKNFGVNDYGVLIFRDLVNPLTHEV